MLHDPDAHDHGDFSSVYNVNDTFFFINKTKEVVNTKLELWREYFRIKTF